MLACVYKPPPSLHLFYSSILPCLTFFTKISKIPTHVSKSTEHPEDELSRLLWVLKACHKPAMTVGSIGSDTMRA
jgi:hypothetical protein